MPNKVIVSTIRKISRPLEDRLDLGATYEFADGQSALLAPDPSGRRAYEIVLEALQASGVPAYIEVDSESNTIQLLHVPHEGQVAALTRLPSGDFEVELPPLQRTPLSSYFEPVLRRLSRDLADGTKQFRRGSTD
jgi:hypothetical protein